MVISADAVELAATPVQRVRIALTGSRALGIAGHFERAIELCRAGAAGNRLHRAHEQRSELELEMACDMILNADTVDEGLELVRHRTSPTTWCALARWSMRGARPTRRRRQIEVNALLEPAAGRRNPAASTPSRW